ncbi:hypothetical protein [Jiella marina]|nr:hypothetical protein [Jiella sp. LLJ827]MCQ0990559.1 hypothetical protein [Jiella sp. LLJ827]
MSREIGTLQQHGYPLRSRELRPALAVRQSIKWSCRIMASALKSSIG